MKSLKSFLVLALMSGTFQSLAQSQDTTLLVNGICEMCKKTIENASMLEGVSLAEWNVETKELHLTFDSAKITLEQINASINNAGYDTEFTSAAQEAYENLHSCCHYREEQTTH